MRHLPNTMITKIKKLCNISEIRSKTLPEMTKVYMSMITTYSIFIMSSWWCPLKF